MLPRVLLAIAVLAVSVAGSAAGEETAVSLSAFVGIPPAQYVVERIGGTRVATQVLVPPGQSPHSFDATPRQMVALAESDVYFAIALPFERELLTKIEELNPSLAVVDMGHGVPRRRFASDYHEEDRHEDSQRGNGTDEPEHEHVAPATLPDPHIWLAPRLLRLQAANVAEALVELDPAGADGYRSNLDGLLTDLDALDRELTEALDPVRGRAIYVFHPAFGYFADAYGLTQVAVETGGSEPSARELAELIERAREDDVRVIFVQPQFASKSAEAVARAIDGVVVPIDPLAYDALTNLRRMAHLMREALTPVAR